MYDLTDEQRRADRERRARIHWHVRIDDATTCQPGIGSAVDAIRAYCAEDDRDPTYATVLSGTDLVSAVQDTTTSTGRGVWRADVRGAEVSAWPAPHCPHAYLDEPRLTNLDEKQASLRDDIEAALEAAGARASNAKLARAAALAEIGELLRYDQHAGRLVGTTAAMHLTGVTMPTLSKERGSEVGWLELRDLARQTLADDDGAREDLHARLPFLNGWYAAATAVQREHERVWWAERGGFDPMRMLDVPDPPGYRVLMDAYRGWVRRLAEGQPIAREEQR